MTEATIYKIVLIACSVLFRLLDTSTQGVTGWELNSHPPTRFRRKYLSGSAAHHARDRFGDAKSATIMADSDYAVEVALAEIGAQSSHAYNQTTDNINKITREYFVRLLDTWNLIKKNLEKHTFVKLNDYSIPKSNSNA